MATQGFADLLSVEAAFDWQAFHVQCIECEDVAMANLVVPRGTRAIVAKIVATHVAVAVEPERVVVDALS